MKSRISGSQIVGTFHTLLACGRVPLSSGDCSNVHLHPWSVWVTISYILIFSLLFDCGVNMMDISHYFIWLNFSCIQCIWKNQKKKKKTFNKYASNMGEKKVEVTTEFTHRISDLYSLIVFWVVSRDLWVFAGLSPVWTAFLRAWSLNKIWIKVLS